MRFSIHKIGWCVALLSVLMSCSTGSARVHMASDTLHLQIHRFDKTLLHWVADGDSAALDSLHHLYPTMLEVLGMGVLNQRSPENPAFMERVQQYYAEPTLQGLYRDAVSSYADVQDIETALSHGMAFLKANFPDMKIPAVYMHVSGFGQNVLVADSLLSLSIDRYLGSEYSLYQRFFYDYQRIKMERSRCVIDYLFGWLMSEYPFAGNENVLLDRMIYQGKIAYIVSLALPEATPALIMGYTAADEQWCVEQEASVWRAILQRKQLYTPDRLTTDKYFEEAPCHFLSDQTPGNIGTWMGWQIVKQYMKETNATLLELMGAEDAQVFLNTSKYKP